MVHWTCDRCETSIEGEPMTLLINTTLTQERPIVAHLCGGCRASFGAWLEAAAPIEPDPAPAPEPDHAGG